MSAQSSEATSPTTLARAMPTERALPGRNAEMESAFTQVSQVAVSNHGTGPAARTAPPNDGRIEEQLLSLQQQTQYQNALLQSQFLVQAQRIQESYRSSLQQLHEKKVQESYRNSLQKLHEEYMLEKEMEEREKMQYREQERIEQIKQKPADQASANASPEVKNVVRDLVIRRQMQAKDGSPARGQWSGGAAGDQGSPPQPGYPYPGQSPEEYFPLRQTLSEPNLKLRAHLHQKMRNSPIVKRRPSILHPRPNRVAGGLGAHHAPSLGYSLPGGLPQGAVGLTPAPSHSLAAPHAGAKAELGAGSPPSLPNSPPDESRLPHGSRENIAAAYAKEVNPEVPSLRQGAPLGPEALYASPSLPNISLGRPRTHSLGTRVDGESGENPAEGAVGAPPLPIGVPLSFPYYPALAVHPDAMLLQGYGESPPQHPVVQQLQQSGMASAISPRVGARLKPFARTRSAPLALPIEALSSSDAQSAMVKQHLRHNIMSKKRDPQPTMASTAEEDEKDALNSPEDGPAMDTTPASSSSRSGEDSSVLAPLDLSSRQRRIQKPFTRTNSLPVVFPQVLTGSPPPRAADSPHHYHGGTAIAYDTLMLKHACVCPDNALHPENPKRLQAILTRLQESGLLDACERARCVKATLEELQLVHDREYCLVYASNPLNKHTLYPDVMKGEIARRFCQLFCGGVGVDSDTIWNELHTPHAVRMAAGLVIELATRVGAGELKNGFAVVRPPGHHAEASQAMGFCFFNNVAIAAKVVKQRLNLSRILIVDWDVHHGNSTQQAFYDDPSILYISIHRHDDGRFFPGTGAPRETGEGKGLGYNVNVAFRNGLDPPKADSEYMAAFRSVVLPIAREFEPELIFVSAGFDGAEGHPAPLGGYKITPNCFGWMTRQLMSVGDGKVVLALEGGYELAPTASCVETCIRALKEEPVASVSEIELKRLPHEDARDTLVECIKVHATKWRSLEKSAALIHCSVVEAREKERENDTVSALASLSMAHRRRLGEGDGSKQSSTESEPMEQS